MHLPSRNVDRPVSEGNVLATVLSSKRLVLQPELKTEFSAHGIHVFDGRPLEVRETPQHASVRVVQPKRVVQFVQKDRTRAKSERVVLARVDLGYILEIKVDVVTNAESHIDTRSVVSADSVVDLLGPDGLQ